MLKSYEAIYENGQLTWLAEQPQIKTARVLITILQDTSPKRRTAPPSIAGKGKTLGDIISPIIDEQEWECLK